MSGRIPETAPRDFRTLRCLLVGTDPINEHNGETTIIVENGPAAEKARQRADWRFRAIFGKEAFNRMSMQSNLEARLPLADAE